MSVTAVRLQTAVRAMWPPLMHSYAIGARACLEWYGVWSLNGIIWPDWPAPYYIQHVLIILTIEYA